MSESPSQPPQKKHKPTTTRPSSSSSSKLTRAISACKRCRTKKIKCDQKFPQCGKCEVNGVECIGVDLVTGREILRSYIVHLEERVKFLEEKLRLQDRSGFVDEGVSSIPPGSSTIKKKSNEISINEPLIKKESPLINTKLDSIAFSKIMSTAVRVQNRLSDPNIKPGNANVNLGHNSTTTNENGIDINNDISRAVLPPKSTAMQFLRVFFHQCNSQLPLFHREEFLRDYFIPIYGEFDESISLASNNTKINKSFFNSSSSDGDKTPCWFDVYKSKIQQLLTENTQNDIQTIANNIIPPLKYRKPLYFLNLVFAVATLANHLRYPIHISESFRLAAMRFSQDVDNSIDPLEHLQGILLYAGYSIMRPTNPGVWYIMGEALRICVDLDLQNELKTKSKQNFNIDNFTRDKRRRIFWCCYSIDRQICFYLDRPFGIPDESINTPYPSSLDDSKIIPNDNSTDYYYYKNHHHHHHHDDDNDDNEDDINFSYKNVSLLFFKIRKIQSQVTKILYTNAEIPREYKDLNHWKQSILIQLTQWKQELQSKLILKQLNCDFNEIFFQLNYHHTLLYIHGLSPKNYKLSLIDYENLTNSSIQVINCYTELLKTKSINYTWAGVHNLFMAGTSYLYALYNSKEIRLINSIDQVQKITNDCLLVLQSLIGRCDAANYCCEIFHNLTMIIINLKYAPKDKKHLTELKPANSIPSSSFSSSSSTSSSKISRESLYRINNGNVHSNLFHLVTELDHLNPLTKTKTINNNNNNNSDHFDITNDEKQDHDGTIITDDLSSPPIDSSLLPLNQQTILQWNDEELQNFLNELNQSNQSNQSSPNNNSSIRDEKKTFELIHDMPNEIIWDEFFANKQ